MQLNGGKSGNDGHLLTVFKDTENKKFDTDTTKTIMYYDEESLKWRRELNKGQIAQTERIVTTILKDSWEMARKKRKWYDGSTTAEVLGPVRLPTWDAKTTWALTYNEKKDIFGNNRIACGGPTEDFKDRDDVPPALSMAHVPVGQGRAGKKRGREDSNIEPVFFHHLPQLFWQEMLYDTEVAGMLSCTPGPGADAMACIVMGKTYVGLCFNCHHKKAMEKQIKKLIMQEWATPKSALYEPSYHELVNQDAKSKKAKTAEHADPVTDEEGGKDRSPEMDEEDEEEEEEPEIEPKPKPKAKGSVKIVKKKKEVLVSDGEGDLSTVE